MHETRKTNEIRSAEFKSRYFSGSVLDIGCGPDLVMPHAVPFDIKDGDAQSILDYFSWQTFDCVYSSHCLEHMRDVRSALVGWWALIKPHGYLVLVVPHEDLYEQGSWPSLFNPDHKATFRIDARETWSPVSYDVAELVRNLPGAEIVEASVQDKGLDYRQLRSPISPLGSALFRFQEYRRVKVVRPLARRGLSLRLLDVALDHLERLFGKPIDQTLGLALAQIQIVARKLG